MTDYDPPIVHLPGTKLSPEVVLHRTLAKRDRIKAVIVAIQWDDDSFSVDWSMMQSSTFCFGATVVQATAFKMVDKAPDL